MRTLWCSALPLAVLLALPAPAAAGKTQAPIVTVRVRSFDSVAEAARLVADVVGDKGKGVEAFDKFLRDKFGGKEPKGVAAKKPLGLYVLLPEGDKKPVSVVAIPITKEAAFLETLEKLGLTVEKGEGGLHTFALGFTPVSFRFSKGYAYFSLGDAGDVAADRLLSPEKLFPGKQKARVMVTVNLERIPQAVRDKMLKSLAPPPHWPGDEKLSDLQKAEREVGRQLGESVNRILTAILRDGKKLTAELDLGNLDKDKDLRIEIQLTPKARTRLAEGIAALGKANSQFPGLLKGDAAANGLLTLSINPKLSGAVKTYLEEVGRKAKEDLKDDQQKERVEKLFQALAPAFSTGKLDVGYSLRGPDDSGKATVVAGIRLKDLKKLKATVKELLDTLPEADKARVKFGVDKVADVSIHRIDLKGALPKEARKIFGDGPLYLAARPDAFYVALGPEGLEAIKGAVTAKAGPSAPLRFEVSLRQMAKMAAKDKKQLAQIEKLFAPGQDARIRFVVLGGDTFRLRFHMDLAALRAFWGLQAGQSVESGESKESKSDQPEKK